LSAPPPDRCYGDSLTVTFIRVPAKVWRKRKSASRSRKNTGCQGRSKLAETRKLEVKNAFHCVLTATAAARFPVVGCLNSIKLRTGQEPCPGLRLPSRSICF